MTTMEDQVVTIVENQPLAGGHFLLSLHAPKQAREARPGQFVMLRLLGRNDVILRRPMSIYNLKHALRRGGHSRAAPEVIQLLYKVVGRGTSMMANLKAKDHVGLLGPLGHGFYEEEFLPQAHSAHEILLVAGGIGIAALLLPAKRLAEAGFRTRLLFGAQTKAELVGREDFKSVVGAMLLATEDGSQGYRGYVTRPLQDYLRHHAKKTFLLLACGPTPMLKATVDLARLYGHPCLVSLENRMGCGLGVCLGCCIRVRGAGHESYQRVCTEGPVFWADEVIWNMNGEPGK